MGHVARGWSAGVLLVAAVACGSPPAPAPQAGVPSSPAPAAAPEASVQPYCDTVARVRAEQTSPQSGRGGVAASSEAARGQVADLVATSPPEIVGEWRTVQGLTDRALASLAATGGDPARIDRLALARLAQEAQPAVARIQQVTEQRCGVTFRLPG